MAKKDRPGAVNFDLTPSLEAQFRSLGTLLGAKLTEKWDAKAAEKLLVEFGKSPKGQNVSALARGAILVLLAMNEHCQEAALEAGHYWTVNPNDAIKKLREVGLHVQIVDAPEGNEELGSAVEMLRSVLRRAQQPREAFHLIDEKATG